ncbi:MAG: DUF1559 domain-containing protein [Planctomycetaceae bacterium]
MSPLRRRGFTLIELLVVIAIIAILVALLLPAVQQVREAARKSQCQDHLHNIAIAVADYEISHSVLPPGAFWSVPDPGGAAQKGSILVHLLPYVEQKPLFDMIDFSLKNIDGATDPAGDLIRSKYSVAVYLCPTDTAGDFYRDGEIGQLGATTVGNNAAQNYAACVGSQTTGGAGGNPSCACTSPFHTLALQGAGERNGVSGVFTRSWRTINIGDVVDGTSNVIYFGEIRPECSNHHDNGWFVSNNGQGLTSTVNPVNYDSCRRDATAGCNAWCNWQTELGFRSLHPGGCQFVMGDAAVRFFSENIDYNSYQRLGGKADGQPVSLP